MGNLEEIVQMEDAGDLFVKGDKEKSSFFKKLSNMFKKEQELHSEKTLKDYSYEYSKFREYVFLLEDSEDDENVLEAVELCDNNLKLDRHRVYLSNKKKDYETILKDIKCYDNLSTEETTYFKTLVNKFVIASNDRKAIRYQLADFNNSIDRLETLEGDAIDAIYQIEDAESSKRLLKRDIALIKDEKERTLLDREKLQFAYNIIYKFSLVICILLAISITFITLISVSTNESMLIPLVTLGGVLIFTIATIYIFRRKIIFELKLNEKKHSKLVSLLNKKNVVYAYYTNFLNFTYDKYKVSNSRVLKSNLADFSNYKYILKRYDNLGNVVMSLGKELEQFIANKHIVVCSSSLENFAKSINIDNKIAYFKEIALKREKIEQRLKDIDKEKGELWEKLVAINIKDISKEKVIEKIMKAYLTEADNLINAKDKKVYKPKASI